MLTYEFVVYLGKMSLLLLIAVALAYLLLDLAVGAVLLGITGH